MLRATYAYKKRAFRQNIRKARRNAWDKFCVTLNEDPRGKPYKTIMKAIKGRKGPSELPNEEVNKIVAQLFVTQKLVDETQVREEVRLLEEAE